MLLAAAASIISIIVSDPVNFKDRDKYPEIFHTSIGTGLAAGPLLAAVMILKTKTTMASSGK